MALIVQKFGGTSVGDARRIANVADIVISHHQQRRQSRDEGQPLPETIVVVSAMSGVTDALLHTAHAAERGEAHLAPAAAEKYFREALKGLAAHKVRACLSALGILFGVGSVVAVVSVSAGAREEVARLLDRMHPADVVQTLKDLPLPERRTFIDLFLAHGRAGEFLAALPAPVVAPAAIVIVSPLDSVTVTG